MPIGLGLLHCPVATASLYGGGASGASYEGQMQGGGMGEPERGGKVVDCCSWLVAAAGECPAIAPVDPDGGAVDHGMTTQACRICGGVTQTGRHKRKRWWRDAADPASTIVSRHRMAMVCPAALCCLVSVSQSYMFVCAYTGALCGFGSVGAATAAGRLVELPSTRERQEQQDRQRCGRRSIAQPSRSTHLLVVDCRRVQQRPLGLVGFGP